MRSTPASHAPAASPFLELPTELRNHVYSYCTPMDGHVHQYQGLGLSCQQVLAEYKGELVRTMRRLLDEVNGKWCHKYVTPLHVSMPGHCGYMAAIVVELPESVYYKSRGHEIRRTARYLDPAIASLLQLYLKSITITYYKDISNPRTSYSHRITPCRIAKDIHIYYHGRASTRQAAFSDQYYKTAFLNRKPLHTRLLRLVWPKDHKQPEGDLMRPRQWPVSRKMTNLINSHMVVDWEIYAEVYAHFKLLT
jgi:hypothetical protein